MRDHEWPWKVQLWRNDDLLIETVHKSVASVNAEVEVCRTRIERGEATHYYLNDTKNGVVRWVRSA